MQDFARIGRTLLGLLIGLHALGLASTLLAVPLAAPGKLLLTVYYYSSRVYRQGP